MTRKLKHYFLAHSVRVISDRPLAHILQSKEAIGRITQWAMEISQYDIKFVPQWAIKSQALSDFVVEWTNSGLQWIDELPDHWVMYFDGSYTLKGAVAGVVLIPPKVISLSILFRLTSQLPITLHNTRGWSSASQRARHSVTSYQERFTAGSQTSIERIWLQQWQDDRVPSRSAHDGEILQWVLKYSMSHVWTTMTPII
jgi:hypothetical protein